MDKTDRQILNLIQDAFPLSPDPYALIGRELGIDAEEALRRVRNLYEEGIIRRIGAVFDAKKMGFASTLVAAVVPEDRISSFVTVVNSFAGVTHNYRRRHRYNVWFTLIVPSEADIAARVEEIKKKTGIEEIVSLQASRTFKINARFVFADKD
jgi:DNA-binding Lrp family transcriptional regulator